MKLFVDGFGIVAHAITRKLLENHGIKSKNFFVNTYDLLENKIYTEFLKKEKINFKCAPYSDKSLNETIAHFSPDIVISLYGRRIIPADVLNLAKLGTFNLHPSLLPHYKGCFSGVWAIINHETQTGITFHEMVEDVDQGKILYQETIPISKFETGYSLWHKTASRFVAVFDDFFGKYRAGKVSGIAMPKGGSYFSRSLPHGGYIDESWDEETIEAFIRAMHFPPHRGALLRNDDFILEVESIDQFKEAIKR